MFFIGEAIKEIFAHSKGVVIQASRCSHMVVCLILKRHVLFHVFIKFDPIGILFCCAIFFPHRPSPNPICIIFPAP
jgi:hypothetical protein